jgi:hypothetical protein
VSKITIFGHRADAARPALSEDLRMRSPAPRRYALVPMNGKEPSANGPARVRRYALARVGVTPRSALGVDRHERLEQIAAADRRRIERHP